MDPALKQRLIGAAVLVALAVIFLPMLIKGPAPDGGASHVPLEVPEASGRRFETRELPLVPPAPQPSPGGVTGLQPDAADPDRIVSIDTEAAERPDALDEADFSFQAPAADAVAEAPAATPPAPAPAAQTPPAASAPEPPPVAAGSGGFAVNLGSYANLGNARELVQRLQSAGLQAYAEDVEVNSRPALRVRLGPYAQRADAEAARQRALSVRSDLPTSVVSIEGAPRPASTAPAQASTPAATAPSPAQPAAAPPPRAAASTGFAVQVGAFRAEADARALVGRLQEAGFSAFAEQVQTGSGSLHRVRVGPELDRAAAERLKARLPAPHAQNGLVVSHP